MVKAAEAPKSKAKPAAISKVAIVLHGQEYVVTCGKGEENKLAELVKFVNKKLDEVETAGTNATETRLFMLTCLLLSDELIETRKMATQIRKEDEALLVAAVDHLHDRVTTILDVVGKA